MTYYFRLKAQQLKTIGKGRHCDGQGLYFNSRGAGRGQWELRFSLWGVEQWAGLGGYPAIGLKEARDRAEEARRMVANGDNPISARRREKALLKVETGSLGVLVEKTHASLRPGLKNGDPDGKWTSPLRTHVLPKLGKTPIMKIDAHDLKACLAGVWHKAPETGRKAMNCLRKVYSYAYAHGFDVDLLVIQKAETLLGPREAVRRHMPALHWKDVPAFYASLNDISIDHLALRLLILSGVRSEPIRHLTLAQIENDVWTVPAQHVKGREGQAQPFRVPLGQEALAVIALAKQHETNGFLFPNSKGKALDRMALITLMKRLGTDARPHGFRSAVRTWISETTETAHDVAEACIGHLATDKVVKAYKRTDYFEKRVPIMIEWEKYVTGSKS